MFISLTLPAIKFKLLLTSFYLVVYPPRDKSFDEEQLQHQPSGSSTTAAANLQHYGKTAAPEMPPHTVSGMVDCGAAMAGYQGHTPRPAVPSSITTREGRRASYQGGSHPGQMNWDPTSSLPLGSVKRPLYHNAPLIDSPYSSLPSSGLGMFEPQKDAYAQDG